MLKFKKSGFTLVEVILACSVFAIIISGIILAINRSFIFMDNIKLSVRATNLAREGMEMVYNIRDTNRRKHSGKRDEYWLNLGDGSSNVFAEGIYVLKEGKNGDGNMYVYAQKLNSVSDSFYTNENGEFWETEGTVRNKALLTFDGDYSYSSGTDIITGNKIKDVMMGNGLEFYRIMRVFGIYDKNREDSHTKLSIDDSKKGIPAEMRFCVKVFYRSTGQHSTELCGVITNFKE